MFIIVLAVFFNSFICAIFWSIFIFVWFHRQLELELGLFGFYYATKWAHETQCRLALIFWDGLKKQKTKTPNVSVRILLRIGGSCFKLCSFHKIPNEPFLVAVKRLCGKALNVILGSSGPARRTRWEPFLPPGLSLTDKECTSRSPLVSQGRRTNAWEWRDLLLGFVRTCGKPTF